MVVAVEALTQKYMYESLEELQVKLDCSLAHLYILVAHLVYWKQAKIINVISTKNVYVLSPTADLSHLSHHQIEFYSQFPNLNLLDILSELHVPKPFSAIIPSKEQRTLYLEALTYLLRHDLVVHLHMYVYVLVPKRIRKLVSDGLPVFVGANDVADGRKGHNKEEEINQSRLQQQQQIEDFEEDYIIPDPQNASPIESMYLKTMARTDEEDAPLGNAFSRLCKYFNGKYQVDEILILEGMSRRDFRNILRYFLFESLLAKTMTTHSSTIELVKVIIESSW